jgi:hypothetical protein
LLDIISCFEAVFEKIAPKHNNVIPSSWRDRVRGLHLLFEKGSWFTKRFPLSAHKRLTLNISQ